MKKVVVQTIRNFALCIIGMIICLVIMLDFAYYYDTLFFSISLIPIILLIRVMDDYIRDTIIIFKDNETLFATIITAIIFVLCLFIAYIVFVNLMGKNDILEAILNFIAKFVDVRPVKSKLGI